MNVELAGKLSSPTNPDLSKPRILVLSRFYLPGIRCGGPVQTIRNMTNLLSPDFEFYLITSDRDLGSSQPYQEVAANVWSNFDQMKIFYASPKRIRATHLAKLISETPHDILYLNSFFDPYFTMKTLFLRLFARIPPGPVLIAPRGEFSSSALRIKSWRKSIYLKLALLAPLLRKVVWHASTQLEAQDIMRVIGSGADIKVAPDIPEQTHTSVDTAPSSFPSKKIGELHIASIGRISRMKNIIGALTILKDISGTIQYDIIGPLEDKEYWNECQRLISRLPTNIHVTYHGEIPHQRIAEIFRQLHLLFQPSLSESYGHVIVEALCHAVPVLISDRTPWRNLDAKGVGWDIPLEDTLRFRTVLQDCLLLDEKGLLKFRSAALQFGRSIQQDPLTQQANRALFWNLLS